MLPSSTQQDSTLYIESLIGSELFRLAEMHCSQKKVINSILKRILTIKRDRPKIVSLIGGAASGKSTLARQLSNEKKKIVVISTDDFLVGTRNERQQRAFENPQQKYNFSLLEQVLYALFALPPGDNLWLPKYNHINGAGIPPGYDLASARNPKPLSEWLGIYNFRRVKSGADFIVIEGDFPSPLSPDYAIYLHVDDSIRMQRRIHRDLSQRAYQGGKEAIILSFERRQLSQHYPYTLPNARTSNLLLWGYYKYPSNLRWSFVYDIYEATSSNPL